ncbi:hypothetical protein CYMTET_7538 [Cymbomonas tetramitiformis]|uniref:Phospholipid scramblase n=1 Tax=Cymbomonas tetramitiformis TaxID=36881 RepID=A0AAE0GUY7_9CHLO|nr:hypothetical protein CYMTET_7538 [Cymbomonas tetramitiformis]
MADPADLQFLAPIPAVMVKQQLQLLEAFCPMCEKQNKYQIKPVGKEVFTGTPPDNNAFEAQPTLLSVQEQSTCFCRFCLRNNREFNMTLGGTDAQGVQHNYINLHRPFKCTIFCCCFMFNPQELTISSSAGMPLGKVEHEWRFLDACLMPGLTFWHKVMDATGATHYYIKVQYPTCCNGCRNMCAPTCCAKVFNMDITDPQGNTIAQFQNVFPGFLRGCVADADNLLLEFPAGSTPTQKALLLGALFLIDFMYFEKEKN